MKTVFSKIPFLFAVLLAATSCVHEYPEDGGGVDPTNIETTLTLYTVPELSRAIAYSPGEDCRYVYFKVEIYKNDFSGELVKTERIGVRKADDGSASVELKLPLHAGKYKVLAWATGTQSPDNPGTGFNTDDMAAITFPGQYKGSSEDKECYEARFDLNLADQGWYGKAEHKQEMRSPMGGVEVISTDADLFLIQMASRAGSEDWDDYEMRWSYGLYFPVGYNAYSGVPNQADTNVGFISPISAITATDASLGFDYIFVNGEKSQVSLTLEVIDKATGKTINTYSGIQVPLRRGQMTIIRGKYLTTSHNSGIGINPDFDGDINITLPD